MKRSHRVQAAIFSRGDRGLDRRTAWPAGPAVAPRDARRGAPRPDSARWASPGRGTRSGARRASAAIAATPFARRRLRRTPRRAPSSLPGARTRDGSAGWSSSTAVFAPALSALDGVPPGIRGREPRAASLAKRPRIEIRTSSRSIAPWNDHAFAAPQHRAGSRTGRSSSVPDGTTRARAVHLVHLSTSHGPAAVSRSPRSLVRVGRRCA